MLHIHINSSLLAWIIKNGMNVSYSAGHNKNGSFLLYISDHGGQIQVTNWNCQFIGDVFKVISAVIADRAKLDLFFNLVGSLHWWVCEN